MTLTSFKGDSLGGMGLKAEGAPRIPGVLLCCLGSSYVRAADRISCIICGPLLKEGSKGGGLRDWG